MSPKQPVQPPFGALSTNGGSRPTANAVNDPYSMPAQYWERAGQTSHKAYVAGEASDQGHGVNDPVYGSSPAHFRQEAVLVEMLDTLWRNQPTKRPTTIFEAGCGRGRLAHLFQRILPTVPYWGIDVGKAQLGEAMRLRPDGDFHIDDLTSPYFAARNRTYPRFERPGYDLVVCAEVLMHIRPVDLLTAFDNLVELTKPGGTIITIDWVPLPTAGGKPPKAAFWNFPHDYGRVFGRGHPELIPTSGDVKLVDSRRTDNQMIFILEKLA